MLRSKTTFVIGAGASREVGLPLGNELKNSISQIVDIYFSDYGRTLASGDRLFVDVLRRIIEKETGESNINPLLPKCRHIASCMPLATSIDNYMEAHQSDEQIVYISKAAISYIILRNEFNCNQFKFSRDNGNGMEKIYFNGVIDTYFEKLFQIIFDGVTKDDLKTAVSNANFIIFNYDRCIEEFLYKSVMNYYKISEENAMNLINEINIIHPYGSVGNIDNRIAGSLKFGPELSFGGENIVIQAGSQIRTYSENVTPKLISNIHKCIFDSKTVIFLGCAFHEQNLRAIQQQNFTNVDTIIATAFGMSDSDSKYVHSFLPNVLGCQGSPNIFIENSMKCNQLLSDYKQTILRR
jgi:hypothetical protein